MKGSGSSAVSVRTVYGPGPFASDTGYSFSSAPLQAADQREGRYFQRRRSTQPFAGHFQSAIPGWKLFRSASRYRARTGQFHRRASETADVASAGRVDFDGPGGAMAGKFERRRVCRSGVSARASGRQPRAVRRIQAGCGGAMADRSSRLAPSRLWSLFRRRISQAGRTRSEHQLHGVLGGVQILMERISAKAIRLINSLDPPMTRSIGGPDSAAIELQAAICRSRKNLAVQRWNQEKQRKRSAREWTSWAI